jgi:hypothetical protein
MQKAATASDVRREIEVIGACLQNLREGADPVIAEILRSQLADLQEIAERWEQEDAVGQGAA